MTLAHVKNTGLRIHTWLIATMDSNSKVMNRPNILKIDLENQGLIYSLEIHRQSERKDEHLSYNLVIDTDSLVLSVVKYTNDAKICYLSKID